MKNTYDRLFRLILQPESLKEFDITDWNHLVSQARFHDLIPFIDQRCHEAGIDKQIPPEIKDLMEGYRIRLEYQHKLFRWEVKKLEEKCSELDYPIVALKGIAYLLGRLSTYQSRSFSDLDFLVGSDHFQHFEDFLVDSGWEPREMNDYDDRYYREWSHAPPPFISHSSGIELDLHHNVSSPISDIKIDVNKLFDQIERISGTGFYRLSDPDLILHCANHFIYFDDLQGKLKDVIFIYYLMLESDQNAMWQKLEERSRQLGLNITLYYLVRLLDSFFGLKPPEAMYKRITASTAGPLTILTFHMIRRAIAPKKPDGLVLKVINILLIARFQWTRYPLSILTLHVFKKHILSRLMSGKNYSRAT